MERIKNKEDYKENFEKAIQLREETQFLLDTLLDCYTKITYLKENEKKLEKSLIKEQMKDIRRELDEIQLKITNNTQIITMTEANLLQYDIENDELSETRLNCEI